eukprot:COSAG01_NODE_15501_length_1330_cov_2.665313_1_plen_64_part_01
MPILTCFLKSLAAFLYTHLNSQQRSPGTNSLLTNGRRWVFWGHHGGGGGLGDYKCLPRVTGLSK